VVVDLPGLLVVVEWVVLLVVGDLLPLKVVGLLLQVVDPSNLVGGLLVVLPYLVVVPC